jgi:hypothetical protein
LWKQLREDVALLARRRRNCRPVAPTHDPLLSAARVDVDVRPTNGPRIFLQRLAPRHRDRSPICRRHHEAERAHIAASSSRTLTPASAMTEYSIVTNTGAPRCSSLTSLTMTGPFDYQVREQRNIPIEVGDKRARHIEI